MQAQKFISSGENVPLLSTFVHAAYDLIITESLKKTQVFNIFNLNGIFRPKSSQNTATATASQFQLIHDNDPKGRHPAFLSSRSGGQNG